MIFAIFISLIAQFVSNHENITVPKVDVSSSNELGNQPSIVGTFIFMNTRVCSECKIEKPFHSFCKDKNRVGGISYMCRQCHKLKGQLYYEINKDKIRAKHRDYARSHKEDQKKRHLAWYNKNKEKKQKQNKEWARNNPKRFKEIVSEWAKNNSSKRNVSTKKWKNSVKGKIAVSEYNRKTKIKRKNIHGYHSAQQWADLKRNHNYMCVCCWKIEPLIKLTRDHIVPVSKGGTDDISNIQPLCQSCNSRKKTKTIKYGAIVC